MLFVLFFIRIFIKLIVIFREYFYFERECIIILVNNKFILFVLNKFRKLILLLNYNLIVFFYFCFELSLWICYKARLVNV